MDTYETIVGDDKRCIHHHREPMLKLSIGKPCTDSVMLDESQTKKMGNQPTKNRQTRKNELKKLVEITHFDMDEIMKLYEQFLSISSSREDDGVIDKNEFKEALGLKDSLFVDRMFSLFDGDNDGSIGKYTSATSTERNKPILCLIFDNRCCCGRPITTMRRTKIRTFDDIVWMMKRCERIHLWIVCILRKGNH